MADLFSEPFEDDPLDAETPRQPPAPKTPQRHIYTVAELTAAIRGTLEASFGDVWVEGEISNCRRWNTGHLYFTLKDGDAQIRMVMFRSAVRYLKFTPEDGLHVVARGRLGVYEPKGEYQLVCEHLQPRGLGALQLAFEQLKAKLQAEGLFARARKRPLPALPAKIGIVTSLDGAALRDIINVLTRRHPMAHLVIRPARVQGDGAAAEVAAGIRAIGRVPGVDVVIVARGGGSVEDLWAFNEEPVARAIVHCPVPVISGVGHEVDFTIADFAADVRAPTPSAAAEMVVAAHAEFRTRIDRLSQRLRTGINTHLQRRHVRVHALERRRGLATWPARLALRGRHLAELGHALRLAIAAGLGHRHREYHDIRARLEAHDVRRQLTAVRGQLAALETQLGNTMQRRDDRARAKVASLAARLDSLSPLAVLGRGYAVCWDARRTRVIRRAAEAPAGSQVRVTLHEGEILCEVKDES
jgi:exodeoxyribonuclease VII large subunit